MEVCRCNQRTVSHCVVAGAGIVTPYHLDHNEVSLDPLDPLGPLDPLHPVSPYHHITWAIALGAVAAASATSVDLGPPAEDGPAKPKG